MKNLTFGKKIAILVVILVLVIAALAAYVVVEDPFNFFKKDIEVVADEPVIEEEITEDVEVEVEDETIKVVDLESKTRPYAVVVNNTPVAVKVQTRIKQSVFSL